MKMKTPKTFKFISFALVSVLLLAGISSCVNKSGKKESPKVSEEVIKEEIQDYSYPLPSAFEVTNMLNDIEARFIVGITNTPDNAESYFTEKAKALNLGIYTADLAYATTYNQKTEIESFMKATEKLALELDLKAAFSDDLPERLEANIDNKEKLVELVTEMFQGAYSYLNKKGRTDVSYLVLAGTVFEGLYLTTHISENTFQNPKILETILFQKSPLAELETMMSKHADSELLKSTLEDIKAINAIYALEEGTTSMTKEQVEKLTETITAIREKNIQE